jgi:hypothetical protein
MMLLMPRRHEAERAISFEVLQYRETAALYSASKPGFDM